MIINKEFSRTFTFVILLLLGLLNFEAYKADEDEPVIDIKNHFLTKMTAKYEVSPHSSDLMKESYDLTTGAVKFERIDANIPGNSILEVAYRTSYNTDRPSFEGWQEEVPRIQYDVVENAPDAWSNGNYCSGNLGAKYIHTRFFNYLTDTEEQVAIVGKYFTPGPVLVVPGQIASKLLVNGGVLTDTSSSSYKYVTKDKWRIACYTPAGSSTEGFKATSPSGVTYSFTRFNSKWFPSETKKVTVGSFCCNSTSGDFHDAVWSDFRF